MAPVYITSGVLYLINFVFILYRFASCLWIMSSSYKTPNGLSIQLRQIKYDTDGWTDKTTVAINTLCIESRGKNQQHRKYKSLLFRAAVINCKKFSTRRLHHIYYRHENIQLHNGCVYKRPNCSTKDE